MHARLFKKKAEKILIILSITLITSLIAYYHSPRFALLTWLFSLLVILPAAWLARTLEEGFLLSAVLISLLALSMILTGVLIPSITAGILLYLLVLPVFIHAWHKQDTTGKNASSGEEEACGPAGI